MSRRRYRVGENPGYDHYFDTLKSRSPILNPGASARGGAGNIELAMMSVSGLKSLRTEWVGVDGNAEEPREYKPGHGEFPIPSRLLRAKQEIERIEQDFKAYQQRVVREGSPEPTEMPSKMADEYFEALARADITAEEYDWILKRLVKLVTDKQQKTPSGKVLVHGPQGIFHLRNGAPESADGQRCELDRDGIPRIHDERGPYNGMLVSVYKEHIVKPYKLEQSRRMTENQKREAEGKEKIKHGRLPNPPWPESVPKPTPEEIKEMFA